MRTENPFLGPRPTMADRLHLQSGGRGEVTSRFPVSLPFAYLAQSDGAGNQSVQAEPSWVQSDATEPAHIQVPTMPNVRDSSDNLLKVIIALPLFVSIPSIP